MHLFEIVVVEVIREIIEEVSIHQISLIEGVALPVAFEVSVHVPSVHPVVTVSHPSTTTTTAVELLLLQLPSHLGVIIHIRHCLAEFPRTPVSYTHLRAHETVLDLVCRLLLEKKKNKNYIDL
eukprot:TRINITY_DN12798_c0_g1_i1.p1 TRINITY_DN12798_c0_g1~~TRINITY_DN12798_c0_g1_i1.p1  ORF type:complete len:123 (+),score=39.16 TRINITY_DN12798_c0_g1_i1:173-541(+)